MVTVRAVTQPRNHEKSNEGIDPIRAKSRGDGSDERHAWLGRNRGVRPSVIDDEFATPTLERRQLRGCVEQRTEIRLGVRQRLGTSGSAWHAARLRQSPGA